MTGRTVFIRAITNIRGIWQSPDGSLREMALPKSARPLCGARTRKGGTCQARAMKGRTRCKNHGGMSTGPRTPEGKARIAAAARQRWQRYQEEKAKNESPSCSCTDLNIGSSIESGSQSAEVDS